MKLIKPKFEIWEQGQGLDSLYKHIERCGRICYKSHDKISEDSAKPFVDRMIKSGHGAVLEHGTIYLKVPNEGLIRNFLNGVLTITENTWCKVHPCVDIDDYVYITTNYRHIIENKLEDLLKYICEPTEFHEKRITVHFVCDRGVSHEFVRHRVFSFAQESTRYCNYSKDKFGNELTFIIPPFCSAVEGSYTSGYDVLSPTFQKPYGKGTRGGYFYESLRKAEEAYMQLTTHIGDPNIDLRMTPQEARAVLPNALKTELVMTGFVSDWKHFFFLRCPVNAHPQARELAIPLSEEFLNRKYILN